ncbi:MAG TPA: hypothetical protein VFS05_03935, partial [Gemmatimonadaceae bacterium]|nr:hypothetical protein [Gemmatimonadaceae bacterium]
DVTVTLDRGPVVRWRCSSLIGFMDAVNDLLARAELPGRFIALDTDGDYHAFVHASDATRERIALSGLLPLARESDPLSGPVEEEAA